MISTLLRVCWLSLKRDRVALLLTFALPIAFFSVFAIVFGGQGRDKIATIRVAVVDLDHTEASRRMVEALRREPGLNARTTLDAKSTEPLDLDQAMALVTSGKLPVAIILRPGFSARFGSFGALAVGDDDDDDDASAVELLVDSSDPVAGPMVNGLLQKVAMTAMPDVMAKRGLGQFEKFGGAFTPQQSAAVVMFEKALQRQATQNAGTAAETPAATGTAATPATNAGGPLSVTTRDVLGERKTSGLIAFYAAGTGVMFLLFSMAGAAGTILEEEESGTLERVLTGGLGAGTLLFGKWFFFALVGVAQVSIMFLWGWWRFKLELFDHLPGFLLMTVATAAAAAAFGLMLAGLCRTRAQLSGLSTVVILIMSAIGGSMFPRFMMPPWVQQFGLCTFNAWALDGYQKIFWYEQPTWTIWPQLAVLAGLTVVFLAVARILARRWEML